MSIPLQTRHRPPVYNPSCETALNTHWMWVHCSKGFTVATRCLLQASQKGLHTAHIGAVRQLGVAAPLANSKHSKAHSQSGCQNATYQTNSRLQRPEPPSDACIVSICRDRRSKSVQETRSKTSLMITATPRLGSQASNCQQPLSVPVGLQHAATVHEHCAEAKSLA